MLTIIDYGMGNLGSIRNMLKKAGYESAITADPEVVKKAEKLILPGVGAFDKAMHNLDSLGLTPVVTNRAEAGTPLLGICLGMQLLAYSSEEGKRPGLGLIPGEVVRFSLPNRYKVPHMGWNTVHYKNGCPLYKGFEVFEETRFYFVHSYHFVCKNDHHISGQTEYSQSFTSAVQHGNIYGVQFHPEKSHKFGLALLKNFAEIC